MSNDGLTTLFNAYYLGKRWTRGGVAVICRMALRRTSRRTLQWIAFSRAALLPLRRCPFPSANLWIFFYQPDFAAGQRPRRREGRKENHGWVDWALGVFLTRNLTGDLTIYIIAFNIGRKIGHFY